MASRADRIRLKTERAKKHIRDLDEAHGLFLKNNHYFFDAKRDPNTREPIYFIDEAPVVPLPLACIVGDAIQNLRSALDHLIWQLVESNGRTPDRCNEFPIFPDAAGYRANARGKMRGVNPGAREAIKQIEPYHGGNGHELWVLHELNIRDKHRFLITVGAGSRGMNFGRFMEGKIEQFFGRKSPALPPIMGYVVDARGVSRPAFPLEKGTVLFADAPDSEIDRNLQFTFQIAFNELGVVEGKPVIETLESMANLVDNLISDFEPFLS